MGGSHIVLLGEHSTNETDDRSVVREDLHDGRASFDLFVQPFERVVRPDLAPMIRPERREPSTSTWSSPSVPSLWGTGGRTCRRCGPRQQRSRPSRGHEHRSECGSDDVLVAFGDPGADVRKWTRQRCHDVPCEVLRAAAFRPSWASEITNLTPPSLRRRSERRNSVQNDTSS